MMTAALQIENMTTLLNVLKLRLSCTPDVKLGLCTESARAVTGRQCPHTVEGEDFLTGQPDFFTETAVTPERKVGKSFPRWEINRHVEG